jgi:sulfur-oxidizing protein SoxY
LLRAAVAGTIIGAASRWLRGVSAWAADWPKNAFAATSVEDVLTQLYGTSNVTASDAVRLKTPLQVENGALVPIEVSTTLPAADSIAIIVDNNPQPFAARISLSGAEPFFAARIRINETAEVHGLVRSAGRLYMNKQRIRITVGACGD